MTSTTITRPMPPATDATSTKFIVLSLSSAPTAAAEKASSYICVLISF